NRVRKIVGSTTNGYLVDTRNLTGYAQVLEESVNGTLSKFYAYGLDLISQRDVGGSTYYFGQDGLGSTRLLTTTNATVANVFTYDAFGTLIASNAAPQTDYLFTGEQRDANLGFYYLRARYLNPGTGRFWSRDSHPGKLYDPPSLHRYTYTHNDPVNGVDPSGNEFNLNSLNTVIAFLNASAARQAVTLAVVIAVTYSITSTLLSRDVTDPELGQAIVLVGAAIDAHRGEILGYAQAKGIPYASTSEIPRLQKVQEGAGLNISGMLNITTSPVTRTTTVNRRWIADRNPGVVELSSLLAHEYGHVLYGHVSAFVGGNEEEANEFQDFFDRLTQ
ncbi:MAG: RHS repeat-associated core domain-containing protein, partial [Verrucomicrobia bacterium]|nr:RHS repeat-associated core domain-containing protein [Verrucomicrobiota bacterium]